VRFVLPANYKLENLEKAVDEHVSTFQRKNINDKR
jgi:hypothetical protein